MLIVPVMIFINMYKKLAQLNNNDITFWGYQVLNTCIYLSPELAFFFFTQRKGIAQQK